MPVFNVKPQENGGGGGSSIKYQHSIYITDNDITLCYPVNVRITIFNESETPLTFDDVWGYLNSINTDYPCLIESENAVTLEFVYSSTNGDDKTLTFDITTIEIKNGPDVDFTDQVYPF